MPPLASGGMFHVRPFTEHCRVICDEGAHAVIGVSPGNSYFSHERVMDLARWGLAHFDRVDLVYTDLHVAEMYEASGYAPDDARRKAVKNIRGVRAKVTAAVEALAGDGRPDGRDRPGRQDGQGRQDRQGRQDARLRGHAMSDFVHHPAYRAIHADIRERLATDADFRGACDALVAGFLATKGEVTEARKQVCLDYVCAEIPLFVDTPAVLGVPSSLNCYHQLLPMAELLYSRGSGLRASRNQGHAILTPNPDGATTR